MGFDKPPKYEYEPAEQTDVVGKAGTRPTPEDEAAEETTVSAAERVVDEYDKSIEFWNWMISLHDGRLQDVTVQINPEDQPEVWMAMQRIFGATAQENLNYRSYVQVLDALTDMNQLEVDEIVKPLEAEEDDLIDALSDSGEAEDSETPEMDYIDEDDAAIAEALEGRTIEFESSADTTKKKGKRKKKKRPPYSFWSRLLRRGKMVRYLEGQRFDLRRREDYHKWLDRLKDLRQEPN